MGTGALIASLVIPVALFGPESIQTGVLLVSPGIFGIHNRLGNALCPELFSSLVDLLHRIGDQRHFGGLADQRHRRHGSTHREVLGSWKSKAGGHRKFQTISSCLGGGDKEHRADHRPESWLKVLGDFEAGQGREEATDMLRHRLPAPVLNSRGNGASKSSLIEARVVGEWRKGGKGSGLSQIFPRVSRKFSENSAAVDR